jgi:hypothetical protein
MLQKLHTITRHGPQFYILLCEFGIETMAYLTVFYSYPVRLWSF